MFFLLKIDKLKRKLNKFLGQSGCENQKSNEVFMRFYESMRHRLHVARPCVWFQVSRCLHRICQAGNVRFMPEARCRRYSLHSLSSQGWLMTSLLSAIWTNYAQHVFIKQLLCIAQWFSNYAMYCLFLPDLWFQMCIQRLCRQFISSPSSHWLQTLQILKRSTALASQSLVRPEHLSGDEYGLLHICMSVAVADSWQIHGVCTVDVVFSASNCWVRSNFFLSKIIRPIYNVVFDEWQLICRYHDIHHRPIHLIRYGIMQCLMPVTKTGHPTALVALSCYAMLQFLMPLRGINT